MLNVGLIGYGYWGPNLARVFSDLPGARLHMLCERSASRLRAARSRYAGLLTCTDPKDMLRRSDIDAVLIATPVSTHAALARLALSRRRHVYVEKPLSLRYRDAAQLRQTAARQGNILMVGHTFLYSPAVRKIKQLIDDNVVGKLYTINASRVNLGLFQADVGVFYDLAPHDLSMFLYWLGRDPLWVSAKGAAFVRKRTLEVGYATLGFPGGVLAHLHVSWLAPSKLRQTAVVGSSRMILYDDTSNNEKVKVFNQGVVRNPETFGEFQLTYRSGDIVSPHLPAREPLREQALAFVQAIRTGKPPESDARFGGRVVKILEAIDASLRQNGKTVPIRRSA